MNQPVFIDICIPSTQTFNPLSFLSGSKSVMPKDDFHKFILIPIFTISSIGFLAAAMHFRHRKRAMGHNKLTPRLAISHSGRLDRIESFSQYVARQMGFGEVSECPQLGKLAYDYVRNKGCDDLIYEYFSNQPNAKDLFEKLIEELDKCILAYFAFHWGHASRIIGQVLNVESENKIKLKEIIMAATRKQRIERVTKDLKATRVFSTLVEEMKAIGIAGGEVRHCRDVMVPAAPSKRSPVLLLMGGGMGAGKSTVLKDILNDSFWSGAAGNAVVVEADAFKETDVLFRALNSSGHLQDIVQNAELVHQSSTDAASSVLVTALNEGRDVIMDGTLSWEPFVLQTIAMARNVHCHRYRMGVGYKVAEDGTITENYWEQVEEEEQDQPKNRKPYRIELVGVVCDAYLAVVRGIRRAIMMRRAVRVKSQLTSHKRFATAFPRYCQLVDNARLFCTNSTGPPKLIGWKDGESGMLVDTHEINCLKKVSMLNEEADSACELYPHTDPTCKSESLWNDLALEPSRASIQCELKIAIQKIENPTL